MSPYLTQGTTPPPGRTVYKGNTLLHMIERTTEDPIQHNIGNQDATKGLEY